MNTNSSFTNQSSFTFSVVGYRPDKLNAKLITALLSPEYGGLSIDQNVKQIQAQINVQGLIAQDWLNATQNQTKKERRKAPYAMVPSSGFSLNEASLDSFFSKSGQTYGKQSTILAFFPSFGTQYPNQLDVIQEVHGSSSSGSAGFSIEGWGLSAGGGSGKTTTKVYSEPLFAILVVEGYTYTLKDDPNKEPGNFIIEYQSTSVPA